VIACSTPRRECIHVVEENSREKVKLEALGIDGKSTFK
jgi:hypothetical protein